MPTIQVKKNTMKGKNAAERGRQLYAEEDYKGALQAFSEAVQGSTEHLLLNALDNRAATFEKLGMYKLALRDAKEMIEMMPKLAKGYLRCGKILSLTKKTDLALQIYGRGLSKVKISSPGPGRVILKEQYEKLRIKLTPARTRDPMFHLPPELVVMVCGQLTMRDRVVCLAVSKPWKHLLENIKDLWTELDTSYCKRPMNMKSLKIHLRRSKYTLDSALITMKARFNDAEFRLLANTCKDLRELRIQGAGLIGASLSEAVPIAKNLKILHVSSLTEASLGTVQSCLKKCENLDSMSFLKVKGSSTAVRDGAWVLAKNENIKNLELHSDKKSRLDMNGLVAATPNLVSATLCCWKFVANNASTTRLNLLAWSHLEHLDLTNLQLKRFPILPPTLKHLILADNPLLKIQDAAELVSLTTMPLLERFNCHGTNIDARAVKHLTYEGSINGHLKRLSLGARFIPTPAVSVDEEYPQSGSLEELSLDLLPIDDARAMEIVRLYPSLRKLDVSGTNVTGVAVRDFVDRGITSLNLDNCRATSRDAVEWARGRGIEVSYNFASFL
ncbi:RNI-like protein [Mollisia scopiformis]|uniref:RNI-like protein n=1 Tax=Mollisia scopiformis TaxID=149040 RepID=A0A194XDW6_MOLSC|nr:RNI-like protein [Mollisia scopiformis]KUJ18344.1 RNI-like protein [Mollisia scopiformis]